MILVKFTKEPLFDNAIKKACITIEYVTFLTHQTIFLTGNQPYWHMFDPGGEI